MSIFFVQLRGLDKGRGAAAVVGVLIPFMSFFAGMGVFAGDTESVSKLVESLGADNYKERSEAFDSLWRLGRTAEEALRKASNSNDPELRVSATKLLRYIRWGITPDWPRDILENILRYKELSRTDREALLTRVVNEMGEGAIPFLVAVLRKGTPGDVALAEKRLAAMENQDAVCKHVLVALNAKDLANPASARIFARACQRTGDFKRLLLALQSPVMTKNDKDYFFEVRKDALYEYLELKRYGEVVEEASKLSRVFPSSAELLYFWAMGERGLGKDEAAEKLEKKALGLNPDSGEAHYDPATLLAELGRLTLAEKEWRRILAVSPSDDVYALNAYFRLSDIYENCELHAKAFSMLEKGLKAYARAKKKYGSSLGMIGAQSMKPRERYLKKKAEEIGDSPGKTVADRPLRPRKSLGIKIVISVKNGTMKEMRAALKAVSKKLHLRTSPPGLKLLAKNIVKLEYDEMEHMLGVTMGGAPILKEKNFVFDGPSVKVAVFNDDICNIYKVFRGKKKLKLLHSFDRDYRLKISKERELRYWIDPVVTLDGKKFSWEELKKGIAFDCLPERVHVELTGIAARGERGTYKYNVVFDPKKE